MAMKRQQKLKWLHTLMLMQLVQLQKHVQYVAAQMVKRLDIHTLMQHVQQQKLALYVVKQMAMLLAIQK